MKNLLLVYNPYSGSRIFKYELDGCIEIFQNANYLVTLIRLNNSSDINDFLSNIEQKSFFDTIVVSGGDGTINIVLNAIMKNDIKTKLGIIPSGTANDFAMFLKISKDFKTAANIIVTGKTLMSDIGIVNNQYFINVFAAGLLSNISHNVTEDFKTMFGKLAYYIKGIEQIPNFVPIPVKITNSNDIFNENLFLFFILNSAGTGGFEKLVSDAKINDGQFDFVGIKASSIRDLARLFIKILSGDYLSDTNILYFRDKKMNIEILNQDPKYSISDIDGEEGPIFPVTIENIKNAIEIFIP